jgi:hypothetical protein
MSARTGTLEIPRGHQPRAWLTVGVVAVAIAVTAALVTMDRSGGPTVSTAHRNLWAGLDLGALEEAGYTGRAGAATFGSTLNEQLVNSGVVPREALEPSAVEPLYSAQDRALMSAVAAGIVPDEVLDDEHFLIRRLANQGLIPREAAGS